MCVNLKPTVNFLIVLAAFVVAPELAHAAGSGMPWEGPLTQILDSLTGPVARVIGTLAIVACGIGMAVSEGGSSVRKFTMVVFGLSIAFTAASFFLPMFGFAGGATF
jgi:type IV secretory pathway VirB2 component (pilin)